MARILVVGNVTLDIINHVDSYPREDDEVRAVRQERRRGGNAGNSAAVLSQLGHTVHFAGTLADEPDAQFIRDDFARHRIDLSAIHTIDEGKVPTSYVVLSRATGTRTIVHYRALPEYPAERFAHIDLTGFDWLHFEGRNLEEVREMMKRARRTGRALTISLEAEKPRPGMETLFPEVDVLLFSRVYARHHGFDTAGAFLADAHQRYPHAQLACGWGERGAYAMDRDGRTLFTPAFAPHRVVDTLGAGDVFNAGVIDGLARGLGLNNALIAAARLAGRKCGQHGLDGLAGL
jgi:ketohexokinase